MSNDRNKSSNYQNSRKKYEVARYLFKATYYSIKDPQLLLAVITNLQIALDLVIGKLSSQHRSFREKIVYLQKRGFKTEFIEDIKEMQKLLKAHKKSPFEFSRQDKYIICNNQ